MLILALDSTAALASVAICEDDRPLAIFTVNNGNTHSETLLPMIQTVLGTLSFTPSDIDLFACTAGPGSFTGVRIGAATLKGLAFATEKPCVGVSSLESLACNLIGFDGIVCSVINARKFLYYALFRVRDGKLVRLCEDRITPVAELESALDEVLATALPPEERNLPIYLTGDGYSIAQRKLSAPSGRIQYTPMQLRDQNAYCIAQLAREKFAAGDFCSDRELTPVYLRPCQAERELNEKMKSQA
ncbi:MAG: tRNA (adenosine(37)-N6)-threonylcarbamoyltransferase complex dimerization subunit type 1 TsaB [Clostridia bacterium]|nr:tRNA (adenosine(37)-N6)-threonylcarbamoyltransferase complex dimerization subunit type 1 TsaB [Clostridia bacterium]